MLFLFLVSPLNAQTVLPDDTTRSADWIRNNCAEMGKTKIRGSYKYQAYECENNVQVNLTNKDESKQGIQLKDKVTIDYKIKITFKKGEPGSKYNNFNKKLDIRLTHFGPNDRFRQKLGQQSFLNVELDGIQSIDYEDYELKKPKIISLTAGESKEIPASITIKRPNTFDDALGIYSAFTRIKYMRDRKVWVQKPQYDVIETNEGVTLRTEPRPTCFVPGEVESELSVSPVTNQAQVFLEQSRQNPSEDKRSVALVKFVENLVDGSTLEPENVRLIGRDLQTSTQEWVLGKNDFSKQAGLFKAQANYKVMRGCDWSSPDEKSKVKGIVLRNPASIQNS